MTKRRSLYSAAPLQSRCNGYYTLERVTTAVAQDNEDVHLVDLFAQHPERLTHCRLEVVKLCTAGRLWSAG